MISIVRNERHGRNDRNALTPKRVAVRQFLQDLAFLRMHKQPFSQNFWRGAIDQIPIIDALEVLQVEVDNSSPVRRLPGKLVIQDEQTRESALVPG